MVIALITVSILVCMQFPSLRRSTFTFWLMAALYVGADHLANHYWGHPAATITVTQPSANRPVVVVYHDPRNFA